MLPQHRDGQPEAMLAVGASNQLSSIWVSADTIEAKNRVLFGGTCFMGHPALDLTSRTAVVIGGTSGHRFGSCPGSRTAGADVVPTGRRAELVQSAADAIKKLGRRSLSVICDVTRRDSVEALLDATSAEFGAVDILVNCAGTIQRLPRFSTFRRKSGMAFWKRILMARCGRVRSSDER